MGGSSSSYTRTPTVWTHGPAENDFIFKRNGLDVGRCYLGGMTGGEKKWCWTIYIAGPGRPSRSVPGIPIAGSADTIEQAQEAFKRSFARLVEAGVVSDPPGSKR